MTTQLEATPAATGRSLVDPKLFDRMSARVAIENGTDRATAERIMDQALAFLGTCAVSTAPLSPSETVDIGWHTFLFYTREYAEFCGRIAGRFIHHVPTDGESETGGEASPWETTAAMVAAGYVVDAPMWERSGNCSQCHNGCHNDPPPDPKK